MALPNTIRVKQNFDRRRLADPCGAVAAGLKSLGLAGKLRPGARVAITAGSRGINNLVAMTRAAADAVKSMGGQPFIVPSMGSHGGATDDGQKNLLADLGISEASMGCPVISSMEVEEIGRTQLRRPGLPGPERAPRRRHHRHQPGQASHHLPRRRGERPVQDAGGGPGEAQGRPADPQDRHPARSWSRPPGSSWTKAPVLAGVAVLENSLDETMEVHVVPPERFEATDIALLKRAWQILPRIPFDPLDVLVVDEMGKNISGTGHGHQRHRDRRPGRRQDDDGDAGRLRHRRPGPHPETHGNANGVGLADITTRRLVDAIDYKATYTNVLTTRLWSAGRLPVIMETDREAIEVAVGETPPDQVRWCGSRTRSIWRSWRSRRHFCRGQAGRAERGPGSRSRWPSTRRGACGRGEGVAEFRILNSNVNVPA